jgi:hypothetical protein
MKFSNLRNQLGQILGGAGDILIYLPVWGLLFAFLFNISMMVMYQERLAYLACMAPWDTFYYNGSYTSWINDLHLPAGTTVTVSGLLNVDGAQYQTCTATSPYNAVGFWAVNLTDTEASMLRPY